jgi:D-glycero-D-manno-heptose 1,7-bisphosphate phosphatase
MAGMGGRPFVFVDRDGTLVVDHGYTFRISDYEPLPGAIEGVRLLCEAGFGVVVVTNQSGIGRGRYTERDFQRFQAHLVRDFAAQGAHIEASYFCPHVPWEGCGCRKPAPGMLERAASEHDVDLARSWVVGDQPSDIELAARAGCRAIYLLSGEGVSRRADLVHDVPVEPDLLSAARRILSS